VDSGEVCSGIRKGIESIKFITLSEFSIRLLESGKELKVTVDKLGSVALSLGLLESGKELKGKVWLAPPVMPFSLESGKELKGCKRIGSICIICLNWNPERN